MFARLASVSLFAGMAALSAAAAEKYTLLTGIDATKYPGTTRLVAPVPGPGFPGTFNDGDRLAGTSDVGPTVVYQGVGTPLFDPNEFGSFSLMLKRGTAPAGGPNVVPFMGIDFLGGPRLDLDGDASDAGRSLVPVSGETAVPLPGQESYLELDFDLAGGIVDLVFADITATNEGGPNVDPEIATVLVTLAGTAADGTPGAAINPAIDDRSGTLTAYTGSSGTLTHTYKIAGLGFELWQDTLLFSATPDLGTLQYFGDFRGWLFLRNKVTGSFPALTGELDDATLWPALATGFIGQSFTSAIFGGAVLITGGTSKDGYTVAGNGGLALTDFGGDLGAYFDAVVLPFVPADADRVVYLEAVGFGINNSFDPVFTDTIGYDTVIIATANSCPGILRCDANCDGTIDSFDIAAFTVALTQGEAAYESAFPGCDWRCANDTDGNGFVDSFDIAGFVTCLTTGSGD